MHIENIQRWFIATEYRGGWANDTAFVEKILPLKKAYIGLDVIDAFRITTVEQCIDKKKQLFDSALINQIDYTSIQVDNILDCCIEFLTWTGVYKADLLLTDLRSVLQYGKEKLDEINLITFICLFSSLYISSLFSHIHNPPIRLACTAFKPQNMCYITKNIPSLKTFLMNNFNEMDTMFWFKIENIGDIPLFMELGDAHIILMANDSNSIEEYDYYINIVDEACAFHDKKAHFSNKFCAGDNRFERLTKNHLINLKY